MPTLLPDEAGADPRDASDHAHDVGRDRTEPAVDANAHDANAHDANRPYDASANANASPAVPCFSDSPLSPSGVRIHIEGDRCDFPYGQGGTFRYRVTLERAVPYRVAAGSSCGFCSKLGSDVKPLTRAMVVAAGEGGLVSYCADCDVGCCPPNREAAHELGPQTYEGTLEWPARTFNGPSDTSQKPGAFFPVGPAQVLITVQLPDTMEPAAVAKLPITIE